MNIGDGELAKRVASGDRQAEGELCRRLSPRVRAYGLKHLRAPAAADDLVQHVLELMVTKLRQGEVEQPARIASFVLGMCRQTVRSWRRGDRRRTAILEQTAPALPTTQPPPSFEALDRERLQGCLRALPSRQLTVVLLTFYAERSGPEIAEELGVSAGNVRVLRHRAIAALYQCMGGAP